MGLFVRHEFDRVIDGLVVANGNYRRDGLGNRFRFVSGSGSGSTSGSGSHPGAARAVAAAVVLHSSSAVTLRHNYQSRPLRLFHCSRPILGEGV